MRTGTDDAATAAELLPAYQTEPRLHMASPHSHYLLRADAHNDNDMSNLGTLNSGHESKSIAELVNKERNRGAHFHLQLNLRTGQCAYFIETFSIKSNGEVSDIGKRETTTTNHATAWKKWLELAAKLNA